jgi:hypothetical protein
MMNTPQFSGSLRLADALLVATVVFLGCKPTPNHDVDDAKARLLHELKNLEVDALRKDLESTTLSRNAFYKSELASTEDPLTEAELRALVALQHGTLSQTVAGFDVWIPKVNVSTVHAFVDLLAAEGDFEIRRVKCCEGGVLGEPIEPGIELTIRFVPPKEAPNEDPDWLKPDLLEKDEELRTLHARWMELRQGLAEAERANHELLAELEWRSNEARAAATARNRANIMANSLAMFSGEQPLFIRGRVADLHPAPVVEAQPRPGLTKAILMDSLRPAYTFTDFEEEAELWSFNLEPSEPSAD